METLAISAFASSRYFFSNTAYSPTSAALPATVGSYAPKTGGLPRGSSILALLAIPGSSAPETGGDQVALSTLYPAPLVTPGLSSPVTGGSPCGLYLGQTPWPGISHIIGLRLKEGLQQGIKNPPQDLLQSPHCVHIDILGLGLLG
mmetsp:Transcript_11536/g.33981  ORF Transcript_11536/g.33981 Transcript_11536/m.33981 type:complete len:146 (-) Transcript_11536:3314-3751(-)